VRVAGGGPLASGRVLRPSGLVSPPTTMSAQLEPQPFLMPWSWIPRAGQGFRGKTKRVGPCWQRPPFGTWARHPPSRRGSRRIPGRLPATRMVLASLGLGGPPPRVTEVGERPDVGPSGCTAKPAAHSSSCHPGIEPAGAGVDDGSTASTANRCPLFDEVHAEAPPIGGSTCRHARPPPVDAGTCMALPCFWASAPAAAGLRLPSR